MSQLPVPMFPRMSVCPVSPGPAGTTLLCAPVTVLCIQTTFDNN